MNLSVTAEDIKSLVATEEKYGHASFMYGLNSEEEAKEKFRLVVSIYESFENPEGKDYSENKAFLESMAKSGLLSPEAAAWILFAKCRECKNAVSTVENIYRSLSLNDYLLFACTFFGSFDADISKKAQYAGFESFALKLVEDRRGKCYSKDIREPFLGKCAVYTVITNGYDELRDPIFVNPDWDYYLFTDRPDTYSSDIWKICPLPEAVPGDNLRLQRYAKTHPHVILPEYDFTVYVDGKFVLAEDLNGYIGTYSRGRSMLCFPHPCNRTILQEANMVAEVGRGELEPMLKQVDEYYKSGYRDELPVVDSAVLVRSNRDPLLNKVMEDWWTEINTKTTRDQISLGYACWKNGYKYDISDLHIYNTGYLMHVGHKGTIA